MHKPGNKLTLLYLLLWLSVISPVATAIDIQIDYSLDNNGFFDPGTPQGYKARQTLESIAAYFSDLLSDEFTGISSKNQNSFTAVFQHPSDTYFVEMPQLDIPEDTIIIFAGSRDLNDSLLGYAGVGGYIAQGNADFLDNITSRGQPGITHGDDADDFAPWGGYLSFDLYANWYFDDDLNTADVPSQQFDFYTNALHEFGHLLGIGTSDVWFRQTAYSYFDGEHSTLQFNDLVPLDDTLEHWAQDVEETVQGNHQTAALTPALKPGERKQFTALDIAALKDIGWEINNPLETNQLLVNTKTPAVRSPDDFNQDGHPDLIWRHSETGQMTLSMLEWQRTGAGLKAKQLGQSSWANLDDIDWQLIAINHLDADQHPDLVWWHQQSGEIAIWYMNQTKVKKIHSPFKKRPSDSWKPIDVTDFNNDGHADIVWWNQDLSQAEIWYINSWGTKNTKISEVSKTFQSNQPDDELIATADFDANATPDLIFTNKKTGRYTLWSMDQQTLMAVNQLPWTLDSTTRLVATKDYNKDGTPDLLLQSDSAKNQATKVLTLITLKDVSTPKSQTDLRFAIPSEQMDSVN